MNEMNVSGELSPTQTECVRLLDAVLDMAVQGKVHSVGVVIVPEPGQFRVSAAGNDLDGLAAGALKMQGEILKHLTKQAQPKKPQLTVLHSIK